MSKRLLDENNMRIMYFSLVSSLLIVWQSLMGGYLLLVSEEINYFTKTGVKDYNKLKV